MMSAAEYFLSEGWVRKAVIAIEKAKSTDPEIMSLASGFSLSVAYVIKDLPDMLKETFDKSLTIYVELDKGMTKRFAVTKDIPDDVNPDYTVESTYDVARKIFSGELSPGTAFVSRLVKVKPLAKIYSNPTFTAKSLILFAALLRVIREVPTLWV
ncbi:MAG: hypothetical protein QXO01_04405 [Nitrososphaerota archaeon]